MNDNEFEILPEDQMSLPNEVDSEHSTETDLDDLDVVANSNELVQIEDERAVSIIESLLFASDRPQSLSSIRQAFRGTQIGSREIKNIIEDLKIEYASGRRGITLDEIGGGYQIRTKEDNADFLRGNIKARVFKLSGPSLEVLSIIAYKQPITKGQIDEIRGVESGHLVRSLMDRGLVRFGGKSELIGKPMTYEITKKFLEVFGLRNINELPTLSEIDELIPEGIGEMEVERETLASVSDDLAKDAGSTYSQGEDELAGITDQLEHITTSSEFFEEEKRKMKAAKDELKAKDIREARMVGEEISERDSRWLDKYDLERNEQEKSELVTNPKNVEQ